MRILSVRAPWWPFIVTGLKPIENRGWSTSYRGPVLIHASKWWHDEEVIEDLEAAVDMHVAAGGTSAQVEDPLFDLTEMPKLAGHLVGLVDLWSCVRESDSPWFVGPVGFVLRNARRIEPIPLRGERGLFPAPPDVVSRVKVLT
jgi:hypothetical protein